MTGRHIHWVAPTAVGVALCAGVLFAVGHHLFYWSLNGRAVPQSDYNLLGTSFPRQQINIAAGTTFAFLVNFALASALATAYAQVFWRQMRRREVTLDALDTTFSAIGDMSQLFKVWIWWRYPLLCCVALIAWYVSHSMQTTPSLTTTGFSLLPRLLHQVHFLWEGRPSRRLLRCTSKYQMSTLQV